MPQALPRAVAVEWWDGLQGLRRAVASPPSLEQKHAKPMCMQTDYCDVAEPVAKVAEVSPLIEKAPKTPPIGTVRP